MSRALKGIQRGPLGSPQGKHEIRLGADCRCGGCNPAAKAKQGQPVYRRVKHGQA